jgi:hypothetical protein
MMGSFRLSVWAAVVLAVPAGTALARPLTPSEADFEKHVRPVLVEHCQRCHGGKKQMGGLRLDSREALLKGGDSGPAVVPGKADASRLIHAVRHTGELKMPPKSKLPAPALAALEAWVRAGAPWPAAHPVSAASEEWKRHWAFQPVRAVAPPAVKDAAWPRNPVDRFILAKLEAKGLVPSPEADRRTLIRRLSFDLVGLPPGAEEVEAFVADTHPSAYDRLVDRLLASPRHGERWARYWLDVARYADTKGYVFFEEANYPWGWTYRDYLIESFNEDRPWDRMVLEQLAADQLPLGKDRRPLRALGFVTLGGHFMNNPHDILDDRIDVVTRGLLGLTVSCARCHDHKFDPIPTADYYSLYGVFASSTEPTVPPVYEHAPTTAVYAAFVKELAKREKALADFLAGKFDHLRKSARSRAAEYLLAAHARRGQPRADEFMLIADGNDLNPAMITRWQAYLERTGRAHHRVWAPWHALAALPEKDLAARAKDVLARLAADRARPINPLVMKALAAPASMKDVAQQYGKLLNDVDKAWSESLAQAAAAKTAAPAGLPDADQEELRRVLHGSGAPPDVVPGLFSDLELLPDRASQGVLQNLRKAVEQYRATGPGAPPRAMVLVDAPTPHEPVVFRRGNPSNRGERVPRRYLRFLSGRKHGAFTKGSGRLELAQAIVDPKNPLTARVLVNRLWLHHFGRGIVDTPGDFGLRCSPPSHPELLDWLAGEFVKSGWSIKHVHRLIVTSAAYRQASIVRGPGRAVDPDNRLLWRANRRRLDLEALRDALLSVGGQLDHRVGGPSVQTPLAAGVQRRTVYSFVDRLNVPGLFRTFDFPSPDATSPARDATLVPQQALFLMNSPFVLHQARSLAARPDVAALVRVEERVRRMYRVLYGREPDGDELRLGRAYLDAGMGSPVAWQRYAQALLLGNEFVFVD